MSTQQPRNSKPHDWLKRRATSATVRLNSPRSPNQPRSRHGELLPEPTETPELRMTSHRAPSLSASRSPIAIEDIPSRAAALDMQRLQTKELKNSSIRTHSDSCYIRSIELFRVRKFEMHNDAFVAGDHRKSITAERSPGKDRKRQAKFSKAQQSLTKRS